MIKAVIIGCSAGGVEALNRLFTFLPDGFMLPIVVVLHIGETRLVDGAFSVPSGVTLKEADEKELIRPHHIYFAPAGFHLLVEDNRTFSLSTEEKVLFARPSIDVTMESMAEVFKEELLGVILTGANEDGARGLRRIEEMEGTCLVQDPEEAAYGAMPLAAIKATGKKKLLGLQALGQYLRDLS